MVRAVRVMDRRGIKRLPVVDEEGVVVGVLSRSDLIQLFLRRDPAIQEEVVEDILTRTLRLAPSAVSVDVTEGVVTLSGALPRRRLAPVIQRLCGSVDGVVAVVDKLRYTD